MPSARRACSIFCALLLAAIGSTATPGSTPPAPAGSPLPPFGFVLIPPGNFLMGSPEDEPGRFSDETQHPVTLTRPFYLSNHLVTQKEWLATLGWNDSRFTGDLNRPVENVSWFDCIEYCNALSVLDRLVPAYTVSDRRYERDHLIYADVTWDAEANGYRLPTDAEWEYACRAGTTTAFYNGEISVHGTSTRCIEDYGLNDISWYCANSGGQTHPVRTKPANDWGLYDMAGNVMEWCWDWFADLTAEPAVDPTGPADGTMRLWRGGGWNYDARHCRSAQRGKDRPEGYWSNLGVRVCRNAF